MDKTGVNQKTSKVKSSTFTDTLIICGKLSVYTTCVCAIIFFTTVGIHVHRNNEWPIEVTWGMCIVVLVGPVLTSWQFMGVKKLLGDVIGGTVDESGTKRPGIADIAKDVVAAKFGYTKQDSGGPSIPRSDVETGTDTVEEDPPPPRHT